MSDIKSTVIIPAAGKGKRMNTKKSKQYIELLDKPILVYTIEAFEKCDQIDNIIIVVGEDEIEYVKKDIMEKYHLKKVISIVKGGKERQDSVYEGIKNVPQDTDIVLIHDGARPFIDKETIIRTIDTANECSACVVGVKVKDTIKTVNNNNIIIDTPNRNSLWAIQTPQAFKKELIIRAYNKAKVEGIKATDDSMLIEQCSNTQVKIVEGAYSNIKITTKEDLIFAKGYLES